MSNIDQKSNIIDQLASDLQPVKRIQSTSKRFWGWIILCTVAVSTPFLFTGPFREHSTDQFLGSFHFQIELFLGVAFVCLAAFLALHISVPGRQIRPFQLVLLSLPLVVLIALTFYGIFHPPFEITMAGKREHCVFEVFIYGMIPFAALFAIARKGIPFQRRWMGFLIAASAFLPAALIMQFACMYDPIHALKYHYGPVLIMSAIGAALGRFLKTV